MSLKLLALAVSVIALCSTAMADALPSRPFKLFSEFAVSRKSMSDARIDGSPAKCLTLDEHGLELCDIIRGDGSYLELQLRRGPNIFARLMTELTAYSGQGYFDAAFVDLNHDKHPVLLVARMTMNGNGIVIPTYALAAFLPDGESYRLTDWLTIQGLGREGGLYARDASVYLE